MAARPILLKKENGTIIPVAGDSAGNLIAVGAAASGSAVSGNPLLMAGSDGTNARSLLTTSDGSAIVSGVYAENAEQISATVYPVITGGVDTNGYTRQTHLSQNGSMFIEGPSDEGEYSWPRPVLIGGTDGTYMTKLRTDDTGRQVMVGAAASGSAAAGNPVLNAGSDGTNTRTISTDTSGRQIMVGAAADGAAPAGNPVLIGGAAFNGNVTTLSVDTNGRMAVGTLTSENGAVSGGLFTVSGRYDATPRTVSDTHAAALAVDSHGNLTIAGPDAFQASLTANPVPMGVKSSIGTSLYALADSEGHLIVNTRSKDAQGSYHETLLDSSGRTIVLPGPAAGDQWETFYPFTGGIIDDTGTVRSSIGDSAGRPIVIGAAASGSVVSGNPVLMAGSDGTNARTLSTNTSGALNTVTARNRIHTQLCTLEVSDGLNDTRLVGVNFYGVYGFQTIPFATSSTKSYVNIEFLTNPGFTHDFKIIGIDDANNEIEETVSLSDANGTSVGTNYKHINSVRMLTAMQSGNALFFSINGINVYNISIGANYMSNPYFMCPAGYVARLKGVTGLYVSADIGLFLQTYDNNGTFIVPGLYFKISTTTKEITYPDTGLVELTAGQGAVWVASGSASVNVNLTGIWELIAV